MWHQVIEHPGVASFILGMSLPVLLVGVHTQNNQFREEFDDMRGSSLRNLHVELFSLYPIILAQGAALYMLLPLPCSPVNCLLSKPGSVGVLDEQYTSSSVLMVGEFIKLVFSIVMTLADSSATSAQGTGLGKLWWLILASAPMAVPAVVFWLMNILSYVSLRRIDASTFTVCAQVRDASSVFSVSRR